MWIAIATNDEKLTHFANFHNWKIISKYLTSSRITTSSDYDINSVSEIQFRMLYF